MTKIILDTDIGDDIDDAAALALAMRWEKVELIGVTTVFLNTDIRARIARKFLTLSGKPKIPVYAGSGQTLKNDRNDLDGLTCQFTSDLLGPEYAPVNQADGGDAAIDFIAESVCRYGDELTVAAIGPLTNIARAIKKHPEKMKGARIVLMGGAFYFPSREWNILCDPEAAETVFKSDCRVECVGLDVTMQTQLCLPRYNAILNLKADPATDYLIQLIRLWNKNTGSLPYLHDALTLYYAVEPSALFMEKEQVVVETAGEYSRGMTHIYDKINHVKRDRSSKCILVAKAGRGENFIREFMRLVFGMED